MTSDDTILPDFNGISKLAEARDAYLREMRKSGFLKREMYLFRRWFDRWYTGNFNPETNLITLYRFLNLSPSSLKQLQRGGDLLPTAYRVLGNEEAVVEYLLRHDPRWGNREVDVLRRFRSGEDISDFMIEYAAYSAGDSFNLMQFFTARKTGLKLGTGSVTTSHRIEVKLKPNEAWRVGKVGDNGKWKGFFDVELEWTVVGPIIHDKISEIYDNKDGDVVYKS